MRKFYLVALTILMLLIVTSAAREDNFTSFGSDSVGVKLIYPSDWRLEEFKWGFMIIEPSTQATLTVRSQYFPKDFEKAYDIDMNPEFALIYSGKFEELETGERDLADFKWDYSSVKGAKGSAMEYIQETYSLLNGDSFYSIELYYNSSVADQLKKKYGDILESVRLMYKTGDLPAAMKYKKEWDAATASKTMMKISSPAGDVEINYPSPWLYSGSGAGSEASFHYLSGDPYTDFDMVLVNYESPDPKTAVTSLEKWVGLLTDTFKPIEEGTATYAKNDYFFRKLSQGSGEHSVYTWIYGLHHGQNTLVFVFACHERAKDKAQGIVDDFMKNVVINKNVK